MRGGWTPIEYAVSAIILLGICLLVSGIREGHRNKMLAGSVVVAWWLITSIP